MDQNTMAETPWELNCISSYVEMRDGVELAVSVWGNINITALKKKLPAVIITTRYWRALELKKDKLEFQKFYGLAKYLLNHSYILVTVDARGSGASFGVRESEVFPQEIYDIGEVINWVGAQEWCDGRVATTGTSYTANTTLYSLVAKPNALRVGVCRAPDFDLYRHLFSPGGIPNKWFMEVWGKMTHAQDSGDAKTLVQDGNWAELPGGPLNVVGVKPCDNDSNKESLAAAVMEHESNFNVSAMDIEFIDSGSVIAGGGNFYNPYSYKGQIDSSNIPLVIRCGWHDAATQLGALTAYATFENPIRVIIGPWSHSGLYKADPFQPGDGCKPDKIHPEVEYELLVGSLNDVFLRSNDNTLEHDNASFIDYFTLGENKWKRTAQWPLPETSFHKYFLSAESSLSNKKPRDRIGSDNYCVSPDVGTGLNNRWHTQMGREIFFPDRSQVDKSLLVYDSSPLREDIEITGHPVVCLYLRSSHSDGQIFVYLECIEPDGRVRLLTEGQLRLLHRKISQDQPPYPLFGPHHSFKKADAMPLIPGQVAEISFNLLPISVVLKKGTRIRIAIAGADSDVFAPIKGCESPEISIERNCNYASYISIPFV